MKSIFSISVDRKLIDEIELYLKDGDFRNKSHLVETAIKRLIDSKNRSNQND